MSDDIIIHRRSSSEIHSGVLRLLWGSKATIEVVVYDHTDCDAPSCVRELFDWSLALWSVDCHGSSTCGEVHPHIFIYHTVSFSGCCCCCCCCSMITDRRTILERGGCFQRRLFVGPIANLKGPYFQPCLSVCVCGSDRHFYPSSLTDFDKTWSQGPYSDLVVP